MAGRGDERRPTSWTARVVAPLVLIVVAAALVLVIGGSLSGDDEPQQERQAQTTEEDCSPDAQDAVKDGFYVVQQDDVEGLSGIASKTCIPLDTLIELNPNLDPQALQVDNCVDLVVDGCKALAQS